MASDAADPCPRRRRAALDPPPDRPRAGGDLLDAFRGAPPAPSSGRDDNSRREDSTSPPDAPPRTRARASPSPSPSQPITPPAPPRSPRDAADVDVAYGDEPSDLRASNARRLDALRRAVLELEAQFRWDAQQPTWDQCKDHWRGRVRDLVPCANACPSLSRIFSDVEASISLNAQEDEWFQVHRTTWLERLKFLKFGSARVLDRVARVVIHPEDEEAAEDAYKTPWYLHWALCVYGVQILMLYGSVKSIGWKPLEHGGWTDAEASDWVNRVTELVDVPTDRPPQLCRSVIEVSAVDAMNTLARACSMRLLSRRGGVHVALSEEYAALRSQIIVFSSVNGDRAFATRQTSQRADAIATAWAVHRKHREERRRVVVERAAVSSDDDEAYQSVDDEDGRDRDQYDEDDDDDDDEDEDDDDDVDDVLGRGPNRVDRVVRSTFGEDAWREYEARASHERVTPSPDFDPVIRRVARAATRRRGDALAPDHRELLEDVRRDVETARRALERSRRDRDHDRDRDRDRDRERDYPMAVSAALERSRRDRDRELELERGRRALEAYRVEERQLAAAAEASMREVSAAPSAQAAAEAASAAARAAEATADAFRRRELPHVSTPEECADAVIAAAQEVYARAGVPYPASFPQQTTAAAAAFVATIEDRRALEAYRVEERQLAAAAEASMREVSDADDADDADDDEDDERSRSRLTSPDSRPPEDVERLVAGLSAQLEDARDALEIAENELTCQICFEERRDAVLMPCMHMLYCVGCVDRVATEAMRSGQPDRCPCCRQSVCGVLRCKASARGG